MATEPIGPEKSAVERPGVFPFGQPVLATVQQDRTAKRVFVLGAPAGAVYARWFGAEGRQRIGAVAVASEPEPIWRGSRDAVRDIIAAIHVPERAGRLEPASMQLNGPSGAVLDDHFLDPLGFSREEAWLCELVPYSCRSEKQSLALQREYDPVRDALGLPAYDWPRLQRELVGPDRRAEIERDLLESDTEVLVTLGDLPLEWFARHYGAEAGLSAYGRTPTEYGVLHPITVSGKKLSLLPLVHPRQVARVGNHSTCWSELHTAWVGSRLPGYS